MTKSSPVHTGARASRQHGNVELCRHEKRKPNSEYRAAEIHSKGRKNGRTDERTNECVTRKKLWKITEFSIARESERVNSARSHIPPLI